VSFAAADESPQIEVAAASEAELEVAAAAEVEAVVAAEPVAAPAEPAPRPYLADEIVAPPASPRRGWWRRGA